MLENLEIKKSLFKPLNKDFIKIKCCEFCRTTKFFIIKTSSTFLRNTWGSNGAVGVVIYNFFGSLNDWYKYQSIY